MSFSLFASVLCTALPSTTPLEFPALTQDGQVAVQAGVHVTPTHLVARNYSALPQLIVFVDARSQAATLRALGPGATLEYDYSRDALENVRIEFVTAAGGAWSTSGLLDLSGALRLGEETFWFQDQPGRTFAWLQQGAELTLLDPRESTLPSAVQAPSDAALMAPTCTPTHVPVVTPSNRPKGDAPPKLERRPLPPV
ncbi:MAG: hypothetical protein HZA53_05765 [Planctomycetes bacterium]|nr:hypothetical protein [Planctomycetota bacterium]